MQWGILCSAVWLPINGDPGHTECCNLFSLFCSLMDYIFACKQNTSKYIAAWKWPSKWFPWEQNSILIYPARWISGTFFLKYSDLPDDQFYLLNSILLKLNKMYIVKCFSINFLILIIALWLCKLIKNQIMLKNQILHFGCIQNMPPYDCRLFSKLKSTPKMQTFAFAENSQKSM